jgi:Protein of unknown function (DUF3124)
MSEKKKRPPSFFMVTLLVMTLGFVFPQLAASNVKQSKGQTVYVPVYSHIYFGDRERPHLLTITLSIRNTDLLHPITLQAIDYYNTDGKPVKYFLKQPVVLKPLASTRYIIKESDASGGSGAKFIVRWKAENKVTPPILEGVMISTHGQQGISFTSRGEVIEEEP